MSPKPFISLLLVLLLLASVVMPSVAHTHLCAGTDAVLKTLRVAEHHHHPEGEDGAAHHHDHAALAHDHGEAEHHAVVIPAHDHLDDASYCCSDGTVPHPAHGIDDAILPAKPGAASTLVLFCLLAAPGITWVDRNEVTTYKIGSSPPFLASTAHSTYLRNAVFLI